MTGSVDRERAVATIYLDFSKVLTGSHNILINKLKIDQSENSIIKWIKKPKQNKKLMVLSKWSSMAQ